MKQILFDDMYSWSVFSEMRQIDFNGHLWVRPDGNVLIDPVVMTDADLEQFDALGAAAWIVVTNRDHEREAAFFKKRTGAQLVAHAEDADLLESKVDHVVRNGDMIVPGLDTIHLPHAKTPGEIALYWPERRLVLAGDLVVGAPLGRLSLLMDEKLAHPSQAALGLRRLLQLDFDGLLVGDGHSILQNARSLLIECLETRDDIYINHVNVDEIPWQVFKPQIGYERHIKDIDPLVGARNLGYQLICLPPGQSSFPLHFHHVAEELFYVITGHCTLITRRGETALRPGDFVAFPPGENSAHKLRNDGMADCTVLALATTGPDDTVEYPDSAKVLTKSASGIFRKDDTVGYWDGE